MQGFNQNIIFVKNKLLLYNAHMKKNALYN